jgi:hypothetical protein
VPSAADRNGLTDPNDLDDEVETVILDRQWAREAPVHELSARGRTVQRRLRARTGGAGTAAQPSRWKRFRFWLFRRIRGR